MMEKIPTLFLRNPENMKLVTFQVNPEAAWVLAGGGRPTVKRDGTNIRVTVKDGACILVEKRRNPTREEKAAGAEPGYIDAHCDDPADKHIFAAVDATDFSAWAEGAHPCEALGPKTQGGAESSVPCLYPFSLKPDLLPDFPRTFDDIKRFLEEHVIEGIVWHDQQNGRMAKIKRRDFNLSWPVKGEKNV